MEAYMKRYLEWLESDKVDEKFKEELRALEGNVRSRIYYGS